MTTPASPNSISIQNINSELGRSTTLSNSNLNESAIRRLARVSQGSGSSSVDMNTLRDKKHLEPSNIVPLLSSPANIQLIHRVSYDATTQTNQPAISGIKQAANGYYVRYAASSTFTASFSNTGADYHYATQNFMVIILYAGYSPTPGTTTVTGSGVGVSTTTSSSNLFDSSYQIKYCTGDWRQVTSVQTTWTHGNGNYGSWANVYIIPGDWAYTYYMMRDPNNSGSAPTVAQIAGSWNITTTNNTITLIWGAGSGTNASTYVNGTVQYWTTYNVNATYISDNANVSELATSMWWYNNHVSILLANYSGATQTSTLYTGYYDTSKGSEGYYNYWKPNFLKLSSMTDY